MPEYYRVFAKQIKTMSPKSQLTDFYHQLEGQKNGKLLFVTVGISIAIYALYK